MKPNILMTSAGRRVSLIRSFQRAIKALSHPGMVISADMSGNAPSRFAADRWVAVPPVSHPDYIPRLEEVCEEHDIGLLVPLIDTELSILAEHRARLERLGVIVVLSSADTLAICGDKWNTYRFFLAAGIACPDQYSVEEVDEQGVSFPLIVKPARGSAGLGVNTVREREELEFYVSRLEEPVIQERLEGAEYTLDVLTDFSGQVHCVVPRMRMEIRAGEVSKGKTVRDLDIMEAGARVVDALPGPVGCITLQCFKTLSGTVKFTEINPRFGGGVPLAIQAGADYPRWLLQMAAGTEPDITDWREDLVMLRYDDAIFVHASELR